MAKINEKVPTSNPKGAGRKKVKERKINKNCYMTPTQWENIENDFGKDTPFGELFYSWYEIIKKLNPQD